MKKNLSLTFAAALLICGTASAQIFGEKVLQDIEKIKHDVNKICVFQHLTSKMTIPEEIDQNWEAFEDALEKEVTKAIEDNSEELNQLFSRYKMEMEQSIVREVIKAHAWDSSSITTYKETPIDGDCNMECVSFCFTDSNHRFENIQQIDEFCLIAQCNCTSGHIEYEQTANTQGNWELEHFGTDRDLYDKDGNQIYEYVGDNLYHRDLDKNGTWLDTWHLEENKTHPEGYRSKENYYEELQEYEWLSATNALYSMHNDCDLECSEECMLLSDYHSIAVVDNCHAKRCNCYYSTVTPDTCTTTCKQACLFTPGNKNDIMQCLEDLCLCDLPKRTPAHHAPVALAAAPQKQEQIPDLKLEAIENDIQKAVQGAQVLDREVAVAFDKMEPIKDKANITTTTIANMGYAGYEALFMGTGTQAMPKVDIPIVTISITFAVFMLLVLALYLFLLRKEMQAEKNNQILGYTDLKSTYEQKLSFLDNQGAMAEKL